MATSASALKIIVLSPYFRHMQSDLSKKWHIVGRIPPSRRLPVSQILTLNNYWLACIPNMAVSTIIHYSILPITLIPKDPFVHHKLDTRFGKTQILPPRLQVQEVGRDLSCCCIIFLMPFDFCVVKNKDPRQHTSIGPMYVG